MKKYFILVILALIACKKEEKQIQEIKKISESTKKVRSYIKKDIVIAHRGSTYWTPEETEAAYRWARNIGADYLELDIQLTKDNQLVAFHDDNLKRTTNIEEVFPNRINATINDFTLLELRQLDAGSWFNKANPSRAKAKFKALKILTLQDVIKIAEGNRILRKEGSPVKVKINGNWNGKYQYEIDPNDNGNRPGIYVETKHPKSNIEKYLKEELTNLGWNININSKEIKTQKDKVSVANTKARLILQSFSPESILNLEKYLPNIPKCLLLWRPDMKGTTKEAYNKAITFAITNKVHIIGTSIAGEPNNYKELTAVWMTELIHKSGLLIHPYSFDTNQQFAKYTQRIDGVFTNRADLALTFYKKNNATSQEVLITLDY
ncbi:MAG: hypothetical protein L3J23_03745 [Flavobacteriaceae bacterium]|nr:hypothetical protein [Flavobacteriaceae bacterium]